MNRSDAMQWPANLIVRPVEEGSRGRRHRHGARLRRRHAGPPGRQALPGQVLRRIRPMTRRMAATTCWPPTSIWSRCPATRRRAGSKGYGDFVMKPDLSTLRNIPWLEKTALVLCDIQDHHTHDDLPHSPRAILKKQVAAAARIAAMSPISPPSSNFTCSTRPTTPRAASTGRACRPPRPISATI